MKEFSKWTEDEDASVAVTGLGWYSVMITVTSPTVTTVWLAVLRSMFFNLAGLNETPALNVCQLRYSS